MTLLLDTHVFLAVIQRQTANLPSSMREAIGADGQRVAVSVASLWEIAIKARLGKLPLLHALDDLPSAAAAFGVQLLAIDEHHVLVQLAEQPPTRDPFDRMLLAQCQVESMQLVTQDRALADHPLAWRPA